MNLEMQDCTFWSVSLPYGCALTSSQHSRKNLRPVSTRLSVLCLKTYSCVLQRFDS